MLGDGAHDGDEYLTLGVHGADSLLLREHGDPKVEQMADAHERVDGVAGQRLMDLVTTMSIRPFSQSLIRVLNWSRRLAFEGGLLLVGVCGDPAVGCCAQLAAVFVRGIRAGSGFYGLNHLNTHGWFTSLIGS